MNGIRKTALLCAALIFLVVSGGVGVPAGTLNKYQVTPEQSYPSFPQQKSRTLPLTPRERIEQLINTSPESLQDYYRRFYEWAKPLSKNDKLRYIREYTEKRVSSEKAGNSSQATYFHKLVTILELSLQEQLR